MSIPLPPPQPDLISGPSTNELAGIEMEYRYSSGRHYRMEFDAESLSFDHLNGPAEGVRVGPIPYRARALRDGQFLVSWTLKELKVHVTLVVDFTEDRIVVSGMMPPNQWEFADTGQLLSVTRSAVARAAGGRAGRA
ncbi:MoaF N-terminal domain-containing protein [Streptomyces sp. NPDC057011]|uniref:MoaF N-terminal domain-containing protein n=1 Tax=unclassified Streptomyces TaxID=2593676 RepID=UPI00363136A5